MQEFRRCQILLHFIETPFPPASQAIRFAVSQSVRFHVCESITFPLPQSAAQQSRRRSHILQSRWKGMPNVSNGTNMQALPLSSPPFKSPLPMSLVRHSSWITQLLQEVPEANGVEYGSDSDGFADSMELMVSGELFDEPVAIVFKQDEVPHVIQKQLSELSEPQGARRGFVTQERTSPNSRISAKIPTAIH